MRISGLVDQTPRMDFSERRHEAHLRPRQQRQHQQQQQQQQHQQIPHIKVSLDQFDDRSVGADAVLVDKCQFSDVVVIVVDVDDILRRQEGELRQLPQNRQDGFSAKDNSDHLVSVGRMVRPKLK